MLISVELVVQIYTLVGKSIMVVFTAYNGAKWSYIVYVKQSQKVTENVIHLVL